MTELLTAAQMRAVERAAMESGRVSGAELMERAGRGVVEAILETWPELASGARSASILCGPGNNGGDGFVIARLLHDAGWDVAVFLFGRADAMPPDARANHDLWSARGAVHDASTVHAFENDRSDDLVVDALFGTGLTRPITDATLRRRLEALEGQTSGGLLSDPPRDGASAAPLTVAVDIPSGLDADSGKVLGAADTGRAAATASLTVTFHALKLGHVLGDGPAHCQRVVVKDIGLAGGGDLPEPHCRTTDDAARPTPRKPSGHKYDHGHALVPSGGPGATGAARLAARGALRAGAGAVSLAVPPAAQLEVACHETAIMLRRVADAAALSVVLEDSRINAVCLGPGLGLDRAADLVRATLGTPGTDRAVVLDADALTALSQDEDLFGGLHERCVLTPHGGEFARMFPDLAERLDAAAESGPAFSKVDATRAAAARAGCSVLFKGSDTVIADPDGTVRINASVYGRAAPWLATAGAGDVLAGIITGLLARGMGPFDAACAGAWLHTECALTFGPGLIAEDLPDQLPSVFAARGT